MIILVSPIDLNLIPIVIKLIVFRSSGADSIKQFYPRMNKYMPSHKVFTIATQTVMSLFMKKIIKYFKYLKYESARF